MRYQAQSNDQTVLQNGCGYWPRSGRALGIAA